VTQSLPLEVQEVFDSFVTAELTTVDGSGQPLSRPVTPRYEPGGDCIDVASESGEAYAGAGADPKVALLFSDPSGSGLASAPQVLVQGIGYGAEDGAGVRVRPERVYVWPDGDATREPRLYDAHMEEVRSGHDEEPAAEHAPARGGAPVWDERVDELAGGQALAVLALVAPDGFPFSVRVPVFVDPPARRVRIAPGALGVPVQPGLACVTASDRDAGLQLRGDLVEEDVGWALVPHAVVAS
jgi:hypothetical protein